MATATGKRLEKLETTLSPSEAAARWLTAARASGFVAYLDHLRDHPNEAPLVTLPRLVPAWAGHSPERRDEPATAARAQRAVRSVLIRVLLAERCNKIVCFTRTGDEHRVALLRMLEPLVLAGRVDEQTENDWVNETGMLLSEVRRWLAADAAIGSRYFGGTRPLFQDVAAYVEWVRDACAEMLDRYNQAAVRKKGRKPRGEPTDLTQVETWVADGLEAYVSNLVRGASLDADLFLTGQSRPIGISHLIDLGEAPPWQR
jgi:hypothetical protein